jgi:hypothetical protein
MDSGQIIEVKNLSGAKLYNGTCFEVGEHSGLRTMSTFDLANAAGTRSGLG